MPTVNLSNTVTNEEPGSWSPDGTKLAFSTSRTGDTEVFVMDADGSNQVNLTNNGAEDSGSSWLSDGDRIAFTRGDDVVLMNADGTNQVALTSVPGRNWQPAWKP